MGLYLSYARSMLVGSIDWRIKGDSNGKRGGPVMIAYLCWFASEARTRQGWRSVEICSEKPLRVHGETSAQEATIRLNPS